jgi:hypothetical protein
MAGLSEREGLQAVISQLLLSVVGAAMVFNIPPDKISDFINEAIKRRKAKLDDE